MLKGIKVTTMKRAWQVIYERERMTTRRMVGGERERQGNTDEYTQIHKSKRGF